VSVEDEIGMVLNPFILFRLDLDSIHVLLGGHDLEAVNENELELRAVVKMVRHPKFEAKTFNNDIAVLKFDDPVPFSRSIGPVCLPQSGNLNSRTYMCLL
jgi:hypothetical protein